MEQYTVKLKQVAEEGRLRSVFESSDFDAKLVDSSDVHRPGLQLAGFYDYFDAERVQLIGKMETAFLNTKKTEARKMLIDKLMAQKVPAVIVCHGAEPMPEFVEMAEKYDVSLLVSEQGTSETMGDMIRILKKNLAQRVTRHGVLVEVYGMGLLLLGESGVGKSEAAIELLKRGHRLISDDAVEIRAIDVNLLEGRAPELIKHYVELRGIGVIDVRQIFGVGAVKAFQTIHLIVNLEQWRDGMLYDRLGISNQYISILGCEVPSITIPIKPGRNLAVILEVAAMNQRQRYMGYNAAQEFQDQINKHFEEQMK